MKNSPLEAPYPAAEFLRLSGAETLNRAVCLASDVEDPRKMSCDMPVTVGIFFDGTNNNERRDRPHRTHSNIVRLFVAHEDDKAQARIFKFYAPGVGTRFPEIGELREDPMGKAAGRGGQARILWALIQIYNAVHRAIHNNTPMVDNDQTIALIKRYVDEVINHQATDESPPRPPSRADWFSELSKQLDARLHKAIDRISPKVNKLIVSVFGFSRGAVQARAFCHWLADAAPGGRFIGIETTIRFVGLFDSVASVGLADSARLTTPLWFADGHFSWAGEVLKPMPAMVEKVVHYVAAHEQRMNFPVTLVTCDDSKKLEEVMFPGMHSDVGGGYGPGAQGRSPSTADLLSQIPLLHMYKAALAGGVRMKPFSQFEGEPKLKADFEVSKNLASSWNRYMQFACVDDKGKAVTEGNYATLMRLHMAPYYWIRGYLIDHEAFQQTRSFQAASAQDKEDLASYNDLLRGDLRLLALRERENSDGMNLTVGERGNQFPMLMLRNRQPLSEWEKWAQQQCRAWPAHDINRGVLLVDHVHDSLAGFYLAYPVTSADKANLARQVMQRQAQGKPLNSVQTRIAKAMASDPALAKEISEGNDETDLPVASRKRLDEVFPVLTDADAPALRDAVIATQTATAREGGGYLRPRNVFGVV